MRIGDLARQAGVNIQTIRFYERKRLLREPARTRAGYRNYEKRDLESLLFIKWCQKLGFTLKEARQLLQLHSAVTTLPMPARRRRSKELDAIVAMAEEKLETIAEKIKALKAMEKQIATAIREVRREPEPVCPASKARPSGTLR